MAWKSQTWQAFQFQYLTLATQFNEEFPNTKIVLKSAKILHATAIPWSRSCLQLSHENSKRSLATLHTVITRKEEHFLIKKCSQSQEASY